MAGDEEAADPKVQRGLMRRALRWVIGIPLVFCVLVAVLAQLGGGDKNGPTATPAVAVQGERVVVVTAVVTVVTTPTEAPTQAPKATNTFVPTAVPEPSATPEPTAVPEPSATPEPQILLRQTAEEILRTRKVLEASLVGDVAVIDYELGTVWDESHAVKLAHMDFQKLAPAVLKALPQVGLLTIHAKETFTDKYGADSLATAVAFTITRETAEKVQWEAVDRRNLASILEDKGCDLYVHPALQKALQEYVEG